MYTDYMMAWSLLSLFVLNLILITGIIVGGWIAVRRISVLGEQVQRTLRTADTILKEKVTPIVQAAQPVVVNVQETTRKVAGGVQSARRIVGNVEDAVQTLSNPTNLLQVATGALRSPGARIGLIGVALGIAARFVRWRRRQAREEHAREAVHEHPHGHAAGNGHRGRAGAASG